MKCLIKGYIFLILVLISNLGYAQNLLKHFNANNGLLSSESYQVVQDSKGYIWIATDEGVCKYDGYDFEYYNRNSGLPESTTLELFEDYKKRLWFINITNELAYLENDSVHIYRHNNKIKEIVDGKYCPIKKSFYVDSADNVYLGIYSTGIIKISKDGEIQLIGNHNNGVNSFVKVEDKELFTSQKVNSKKVIKLKNPLLSDSIFSFVSSAYSCRSFFIRYKGKILYSDCNYLHVFNEDGSVESHHFDNDILWISEDENHNLWLGFHYGGAVVYEDFSFSKKKYHLLKNESVSCVFVDNEGSYWISTLNEGVYMYSPLSFVSFDASDGVIGKPITKIEKGPKSILFAGNGSDYYELINNKLYTKKLQRKYSAKKCTYLGAYGDSVFMSFQVNRNFLFYNGKVIDLNISSYSDIIAPLFESLLFFSSNRIKFFEDGEINLFKSNFYNDAYDAIHLNDTTIWFATNGGLMEVTASNKVPKKVTLSPLVEGSLYAISIRDSVVWLSSNDYGLISIKNENVKSFYPQSLINKSVNSIVDLDTIIYLGTNDGVMQFRKDKDSLIIDNAIRISSGNGLLSNDVYDITYSDGSIYVATSEGVTFFPANINFNESPLYLKSIKINGNDTAIQSNFSLSYDQNYIDFEFSALNYQRNEPVRYSYKLIGIDREWRTTHERKAQYSALTPGKYTFNVRAINSYGLINSKPLTVLLTINKAYYDTFLFKFLMLLVFLLLVTSIFFIILRIRLREEAKRHMVEYELNRSRMQALSAQMNPHFIYNSLNSVQSYILKNEKLKASEYLSKLGKLMRNVLNNSQNHVVTLREEFDALERYIEMEQLRFKGLFNYKFDVCSRIDLDAINVPPLIIQPFVENAIHHGLRLRKEQGELLVDAKIEDEALQIIVQDDGVGINKAKQINSKARKNHKSFGTEITHKRLKLLEEMNKEKVTLTVSEAYPENKMYPGTKVRLLIKLS